MAKLTLSVDDRVVSLAKRYAEGRRTSVSRLVEEYLGLVSRPTDAGLTPVLTRLLGILKGSGLDERAYKRHLREKHG